MNPPVFLHCNIYLYIYIYMKESLRIADDSQTTCNDEIINSINIVQTIAPIRKHTRGVVYVGFQTIPVSSPFLSMESLKGSSSLNFLSDFD